MRYLLFFSLFFLSISLSAPSMAQAFRTESIYDIAATEAEIANPRPAVIAPLAANSLTLDAAHSIINNSPAIVAVGKRGQIITSIDNGENWLQSPSPHNALLTAVDFSETMPQNGVAVGHDATILTTNDGGLNWKLVNFSPQLGSQKSFMDVLYLPQSVNNGQSIIAAGTFGLAMRSDDNGETWHEITIAIENEYGEIVHIFGLTHDGANTILATAEFGELYISHDNGENFSFLDTAPYYGSFFGGIGIGKGNFLIFGLEGKLFHTEDYGETWQEISTNLDVSLQGGRRLSNGDIYIMGLGGAMLHSNDNGSTFTDIHRPDRAAASNIIEANNGNYILLTEFGPEFYQNP